LTSLATSDGAHDGAMRNMSSGYASAPDAAAARVRAAPVKIFGDLHGQFGDLMRLFEEYGTPSTAGDITYIDYLFLGDYVDRGAHSLETMCLLLALKIEHPRSVHLIRGNHEVRRPLPRFCSPRAWQASGARG